MHDEPESPPAARPRGMQVQSIRFSVEQWALVQEIAQESGVSAGQFVRESAVAHAIAVAVERGGTESSHIWLQTLETLRAAGLDALEVAYHGLG
jgi:hypothetical protein